MKDHIIIDNITKIDVSRKRLRIKVMNKHLFPLELRGSPKTYYVKLFYENKDYECSYTIGSRDGKSRSGILKLSNSLNNEIKLRPGQILSCTAITNLVYEIEIV